MKRRLITALGCALALSWSAFAEGTDTTPPSADPAKDATQAPAGAKKSAGYPFRGKLKSVDATAKTFTLAGKEKARVFHVTSDTKFTKAGKAVNLADGKADEEVAGYARTGSDGKSEAVTVRFGPAPEDAKTKKTTAKAAPAGAPAAGE